MTLGSPFGVDRIKAFVCAVCCALCCTLGFLQVGLAQAQEQSYPNKTIRLVVGFPPGGANDVLARQLAPRLSTALGGQSVIVENIGAAGGTVGPQR